METPKKSCQNARQSFEDGPINLYATSARVPEREAGAEQFASSTHALHNMDDICRNISDWQGDVELVLGEDD
jgi:hypothetical protein